VALGAWKAGHVAPTRHEIPVELPKGGPKLEPVSARLKREFIHPDRSSMLVGVRFSPDGRRLIAGDFPGGVVVVWDVATGKDLRAIDTGYSSLRDVPYFLLTPDWQTMLAFWSKRKTERIEKHGKRLFRREYESEVRAWDLANGRLQRTFWHRPARFILSMQLSPDGSKFVTYEVLPGTDQGRPKRAISLWDVDTGRSHSFPGSLWARFSPDGRALAIDSRDESGSPTGFRILDTATGRQKVSIPFRDKKGVYSVSAFSPDGRLLAGCTTLGERATTGDETRSWLKWWDTAAGREALSFTTAGAIDWKCCFAPDGRTFAAVNRAGQKVHLLLFSVGERKLLKALFLGDEPKGATLTTSEPVFRPDGRWLALTTQAVPENRPEWDLDVYSLPQPRIHLIDVAAGAIRETLIAPQGIPHKACCFSPDGRTLATGGHGRVLLWDLAKLLRITQGARQFK
jgi:WD40 repeat protein